MLLKRAVVISVPRPTLQQIPYSEHRHSSRATAVLLDAKRALRTLASWLSLIFFAAASLAALRAAGSYSYKP